MSKLDNNGSLLIEVLIAISIFSIMAITLSSAVLASIHSVKFGGRQTQAAALATEGIEAVKAIVAVNWNDIYNKSKGVSYKAEVVSGSWTLSNTPQTESITLNSSMVCNREIFINDIEREGERGTGIIKTTGTRYDDPSTQKITVRVSCTGLNPISKSEYFSRYKNEVTNQSNWSSPPSPTTWLANTTNNTKYDSAANINAGAAEIKLQSF